MPSAGMVAISWLALAVAGACAAVILDDIFRRGFRQPMRVMETVWPVTALYWGPLALWGYWRFGRPETRRWQQERGREHPPQKPKWATTAIAVSHCGAGCTLGDIGAEFLVFALGITVFGTALWPEMAGDYVFALALGIVFQYLAIAPMRGLSFGKGIRVAAKADFLSLTTFEIGLFGWMALMSFVLYRDPHLTPVSPVYWFLMQIGMIVGFATAWPTNVVLLRRGVKEPM